MTDRLKYNLFWLLILSGLVLGAIQPMFTFSKFYIFNNTYSLFSGIILLLEEGEFGVFIILFSFTILLPAYKMKLLFSLINNRIKVQTLRESAVKRLETLGKWSMLDVFVVAILVVTVKLGSIANVTAHTGLYIFAISVIGSMWITYKISRLQTC